MQCPAFGSTDVLSVTLVVAFLLFNAMMSVERGNVIPLTWLCLKVGFARSVVWLASLAIATNCLAIALMCRYWTGRELQEGLAGLALFDSAPLTFAGTLVLLRRVGRCVLVSGRSDSRHSRGDKPPAAADRRV